MIKAAGVAAVLILAAASASAQDFQVGSRAKGMGGSYTSFDEDPVSIWLNPAGIAGAPSRLAVDYQTFTQYELKDSGTTLGSRGKAQFGLLDPPIVPSFIGFTTLITRTENMQYEFGIAMIRPFENRLTYLNGAVRVQTEQQFTRFRAAFASEWTTAPFGFFHSLSAGLGLDLAYTLYQESDDAGALDRRDNETGLGYGLGFLAGVYTNQDNFSVDFGVAYQSKVNYRFKIDNQFFPVWDWPAMLNLGFCVKLLDRMDLRLTADVQVIYWDMATKNDLTGAGRNFKNSTNWSLGAEYYVRLTDTVALLPRTGFRIYQAPWRDKNNLPAIGANVLSVDTKNDRFNIVTMGFSLQWVTDNKVRAFDVGIETGGDTPNFSIGYRHDF
jgi:long-subunit fatty acid transport protein